MDNYWHNSKLIPTRWSLSSSAGTLKLEAESLLCRSISFNWSPVAEIFFAITSEVNKEKALPSIFWAVMIIIILIMTLYITIILLSAIQIWQASFIISTRCSWVELNLGLKLTYNHINNITVKTFNEMQPFRYEICIFLAKIIHGSVAIPHCPQYKLA